MILAYHGRRTFGSICCHFLNKKHSYHSNEKDNYLQRNDEDISGVASRRRPVASRKKNNDETKSGSFELPDRAEVAVHVGGQVAGVLLHQLPQHHLSLHLKKPQLCRSLLMAYIHPPHTTIDQLSSNCALM